MEIKPIGIIKSVVTQSNKDESWGGVVSSIHLDAPFAAGLKDLDQFSHIVVVFYMHQATFNPAADLVHRPRGRADMPEVGIFAQRAKRRPNPIGITVVKLLGIDGSVIRVCGLDAIDGTPVLDIKPYVPVFDRAENVTVPEWVDRLMKDYF